MNGGFQRNMGDYIDGTNWIIHALPTWQGEYVGVYFAARPLKT